MLERKRYFPHLLPLKEGGEGNTHSHFSLYFLPRQKHNVVQSIQIFIASIMIFFICSDRIVEGCCAALDFFFFFFSEINLPDRVDRVPKREGSCFYAKFRCGAPSNMTIEIPQRYHELHDEILSSLVRFIIVLLLNRKRKVKMRGIFLTSFL